MTKSRRRNFFKSAGLLGGKNDENGGHGRGEAKSWKTVWEWNNWWWAEKNSACLRCRKECKQSDKVKVIVCPAFTKIDADEDETEQ